MRHDRKRAAASRDEARRCKLICYRGNPCRNGHHDGIRYTANSRCVECAKADALKQNEKRKVDRKDAKRKTRY